MHALVPGILNRRVHYSKGFLEMEPSAAPPLNQRRRAWTRTNPYHVGLIRPPRFFHPVFATVSFPGTEGDTIIKEGDADRALFKFYIVEEGEARAYVHEDGEDVLMSHLRPGEKT